MLVIGLMISPQLVQIVHAPKDRVKHVTSGDIALAFNFRLCTVRHYCLHQEHSFKKYNIMLQVTTATKMSYYRSSQSNLQSFPSQSRLRKRLFFQQTTSNYQKEKAKNTPLFDGQE